MGCDIPFHISFHSFSRIHRSAKKKGHLVDAAIWLGRKWHYYGTDLWGSLKLFLFQTGKKPKCFHKAEWSHIFCLHIICLYLSASGAILSKIHLQNIFTLKPVSEHKIKAAIKMFKADFSVGLSDGRSRTSFIDCKFKTFFPRSLPEKCRILDCWKSTHYYIWTHCKNTWPKEMLFRTYFLFKNSALLKTKQLGRSRSALTILVLSPGLKFCYGKL